MKKYFEIVEVSPRDGLQNEKKILSTQQKLELINRSIDDLRNIAGSDNVLAKIANVTVIIFI